MSKKSLVSRMLAPIALVGIAGLSAACSSMPQRADFSLDETVKKNYTPNGFVVSKNPTAFTTLTASANTNFGSVSTYAEDITSHNHSISHEYDLGASATFNLNEVNDVNNQGEKVKRVTETLTVGADRYTFPNNRDLDASKEGWLEVATNRTASYVDRLALRFTDARWGSAEGNLLKLSADKSFDFLGRNLTFTGELVRNEGYFIGRGNHDEFASLQLSVPLWSTETYSVSAFGKVIEAMGNDHLTDTNTFGISLTIPLGGIGKKK